MKQFIIILSSLFITTIAFSQTTGQRVVVKVQGAVTTSDVSKIVKDSIDSIPGTVIKVAKPFRVRESDTTLIFQNDSIPAQLTYTDDDTTGMGSDDKNIPSVGWVKGRIGSNSADSSIFETQYQSDTAKVNIRNEITDAAGGGVTSVNGNTGAVTVDKTTVGLPDVDNTSDADKPVSDATQDSLNLKLNAVDSTKWIKKENNYILTNPSINYIDSPNNDIIFSTNTSQANRITKANQLREIFGGYDNQIDSNLASAIISSRHSLITGFVDHTTILGGSYDTVNATSGTGAKIGILSSSLSKITGSDINYAGIAFSQSSTIDSSSNASAIGGFTTSINRSNFSTALGGYKTSIHISPNTAAAGGMNDSAFNAGYSFMGGGLRNKLYADYSSAIGGADNTLRGTYSSSIGGSSNTQSTSYLTDYSMFFGGLNNTQGTARNTRYSWMSGRNGVLSGDYSSIPYGYGNTVQGDYAAALGRGASVTATGSVSWADGSGTGVTNAELYKFNLFFTNGYKFGGGAITSSQYRVSSLNTAPSSATDTGVLGEIRITSTYIYVCTATNTWVRAALSTW